MPDDANMLQWLAEQSGLPETRFRFYRQPDEAVLATIERGILFVMAFWSAPAHVFFKHLTGIVGRLDPEVCIEIVVIDIDGILRLYELLPVGSKLGGNGEAAWIRKGQIESVFVPRDCPRPLESLEQFTKALLLD